eukprot:TRINITY_DN5886_c0_g1_i1.p1 TRINITY_DN5886_c0_g1~~TRINITY_DN5886_c0_g1_i1.p1  ORF type:complete len:482 (+),score=86.98 TRINITY_DN5886_c0_g1_i1:83-1447(+)
MDVRQVIPLGSDSSEFVYASEYDDSDLPYQLWISQQNFYILETNEVTGSLQLSQTVPIPSNMSPLTAFYAGAGSGEVNNYQVLLVPVADPNTLYVIDVTKSGVQTLQTLSLPQVSGNVWGNMVSAEMPANYVYLLGLTQTVSLQVGENLQWEVVNSVQYAADGCTAVMGGGIWELVDERYENVMFVARGDHDTEKSGQIVTLYADSYGKLAQNASVTYLQQQPNNFFSMEGEDNLLQALFWTQSDSSSSSGVLFRWEVQTNQLSSMSIPFSGSDIAFTTAVGYQSTSDYAMLTAASQTAPGFTLFSVDVSKLVVLSSLEITDSYAPLWAVQYPGDESNYAAVIGTRNETQSGYDVLTMVDYAPNYGMRHGVARRVSTSQNTLDMGLDRRQADGEVAKVKRSSSSSPTMRRLLQTPPTCTAVMCGPTAAPCPGQNLCCEYQRQMYCCAVAPYPTL